MTKRAVRLVTEVAAVDRPFDYLVSPSTERVGVGDKVRVDFHHRRVSGWVLADVPGSDDLKPLVKWQSYGAPPTLIPVLEWAAARWCAPLVRFFVAVTPKRNVTTLPSPPPLARLSNDASREAMRLAPGVHQVAPTVDPLPLILGAYDQTMGAPGSLLVIVPSEGWAARLSARLRQRGLAVAFGDEDWPKARAEWPVIVGVRGAAFAPTPRLRGAVVIDADDEALRTEGAPTWDAMRVVRERATRDGAPWWATSVMASPTLRSLGTWHDAESNVGGWPRIEVVDRRRSDPRDGVLALDALVRAHAALATDEPVAVVVVLQRLGSGRLFACRACGELARCATCGAGELEDGSLLRCPESHETRAVFCRSCGATNLRRVRSGITTLARDVAAQLRQPVSEISATSPLGGNLSRVVVGTEAVWRHVRRCALVIFVDFDQYLLAPRSSARRRAVDAVAKAGRLVGSRRDGRGAVLLQTRRGDDDVVRALQAGDVEPLAREDVATAQLLGLPPFRARAEVQGDGAEDFVAQLGDEIRVQRSGEIFVVSAATDELLTGALRRVVRPAGRLRVAID